MEPKQQPERRQLDNGLCYYLYGQGEPLILLHGFAEDASIWARQIEALSQNNLLVLPELPGSGGSASILPINCIYTVEAFASIIKELADKEKWTKITLMGHSMGGYVTLAFAELFPDRLNAFGLLHSTAFADTDEKKDTRKKSIAFIRQHGTGGFMSTMIPGLYGERFLQQYPEVVREHIQLASSFKEEVLAAYSEMMMIRPDRRSLLAEYDKPVLFVIGTEDKAVNLKDSLLQCHMPVNSLIRVLEHVGHMGMKESPENMNDAILDFLAYLKTCS